jgi:hypothetical protein
MVIAAIASSNLVSEMRRDLSLPETDAIDIPLIATLVRRAAGILCPCSRASLAAKVYEGLKYLTPEPELLNEQIDTIVDALLVAGDLLELNQVTYEDPAVKGTWVFAAPPSFVDRKNGTIFLIGTTRDELMPLPRQLADRVVYDRCSRLIRYSEGELLPQTLRELGLVELSERFWLRSPREETARAMVDSFTARLMSQSPSGAIEELQLLDPASPVGYYLGRWVSPRSQSGNFVSRRPHAYGAPIWGFVSTENGRPTHFLDFPFGNNIRWRGCDVAWHLQMAIDNCNARPQRYRRRDVNQGAVFDFYSPLPLWAERRLAIFGATADRNNSLLSYFVPADQLISEERFIQERLWLTKID